MINLLVVHIPEIIEDDSFICLSVQKKLGINLIFILDLKR